MRSDPQKTGSAASLVNWEDLGRAGRDFVTTGPSRADIEAFLGAPALEPIRVYAGLIWRRWGRQASGDRPLVWACFSARFSSPLL
jgi:uncharacterized membrane protein